MKNFSKVMGHRVGGGYFRPRLVRTKNGRKFKGQGSDPTKGGRHQKCPKSRVNFDENAFFVQEFYEFSEKSRDFDENAFFVQEFYEFSEKSRDFSDPTKGGRTPKSKNQGSRDRAKSEKSRVTGHHFPIQKFMGHREGGCPSPFNKCGIYDIYS